MKKSDKQAICVAYEQGFSKLLFDNGFAVSRYIEYGFADARFTADITAYQNSLLDMGSPFVKRKVFFQRCFAAEPVGVTYEKIVKTDYPASLLPTRSACDRAADLLPQKAYFRMGQFAQAVKHDGFVRATWKTGSVLRRLISN